MLTDSDLVVRSDGSLVELQDSLSPREELAQFVVLFRDWKIWALVPMFFASNYCEWDLDRCCHFL